MEVVDIRKVRLDYYYVNHRCMCLMALTFTLSWIPLGYPCPRQAVVTLKCTFRPQLSPWQVAITLKMYGLPVISSPEGPLFSQSIKCTHVSRMVVLRGLCPFYPPYPHRVVKMPLQYSPQSMITTQNTTSARETCTCTNLLVRMSIFLRLYHCQKAGYLV